MTAAKLFFIHIGNHYCGSAFIFLRIRTKTKILKLMRIRIHELGQLQQAKYQKKGSFSYHSWMLLRHRNIVAFLLVDDTFTLADHNKFRLWRKYLSTGSWIRIRIPTGSRWQIECWSGSVTLIYIPLPLSTQTALKHETQNDQHVWSREQQGDHDERVFHCKTWVKDYIIS